MPVALTKGEEKELTTLLSKLIQIDTTNPPGNESKAAEFLATELEKDDFQCELFESSPTRTSLITRLKRAATTTKKPRILLLSHTDVVPADPKEWTVDPFSGILKDGCIYGRGALDMKSMTAMEVMVLKMIKRNGIKTKGDVILGATADEEMGGLGGADYLLRHHWEKIFAEYVLNEGGGNAIPLRKANMFTINTAEKGLFWFRVKAKGTPGHGSMPEAADNAIVRMNKVLEKLGNYSPKPIFVPTVRQFLMEFAAKDPSLQQPVSRMLANSDKSEEVLDEIEKSAMPFADEVRPRIRMTITPTMIHGGVKENVIPSEAEAVFDCRVLPGQSTGEAFSKVKELLRGIGLNRLSFEIIQAQEPSESPRDTPLFSVIKEVLSEFEPGCGVAPLLMAGGTDSRFFRRMGSVCYGFQPMRSETQFGVKPTRREHGADERISVENLIFGASVLYETVKRFMT